MSSEIQLRAFRVAVSELISEANRENTPLSSEILPPPHHAAQNGSASSEIHRPISELRLHVHDGGAMNIARTCDFTRLIQPCLALAVEEALLRSAPALAAHARCSRRAPVRRLLLQPQPSPIMPARACLARCLACRLSPRNGAPPHCICRPGD